MDLWMMSSGRTLEVLEERKTTSVELPINHDLLPLEENRRCPLLVANCPGNEA